MKPDVKDGGNNKTTYGVIIIIGVLVIAAALFLSKGSLIGSPTVGGQKDAHGCLIGAGYSWCGSKQKCMRKWEETCPGEGLPTPDAARTLAGKGPCVNDGTLGNDVSYDENTRTWWISLIPSAPKAGCNPACVVSEDTWTSETNWRCTGLIPQ